MGDCAGCVQENKWKMFFSHTTGPLDEDKVINCKRRTDYLVTVCYCLTFPPTPSPLEFQACMFPFRFWRHRKQCFFLFGLVHCIEFLL